MGDISQWELFKETKISPVMVSGSNKVELTGIKRKDGLSVLRLSMSFPFGVLETFRVRGDFGEFYFYASRLEVDTNKPLDTYTVCVHLAGPDWPVVDKARNAQLIQSMAKDLESALLHYPVGNSWIYNKMPVKKVVFDISLRGTPHLVSAKELQP